MKIFALSRLETHLVRLFFDILTLARPEIQASLSRILASAPSLPHLPKPSESFCPAEQTSLSHSFLMNDFAAPPPATLSRPPLLIIDPHQMVDRSCTLRVEMSGTIPCMASFRRLRCENKTARKAPIRRSCHTSAQFTDVEVKGSGFPR